MRSWTCGLAVFALAAALGAATASAQQATVTIDTRAPQLAARDGGGWTVAVGLTNLTDDSVAVAVATPDAGCTLTLDKSTLPAAEHSDLTMTVPAACSVPDSGIRFVITASSSGASGAAAATERFSVAAAPKPDPSKPDWDQLVVFPIALVLLFVLIVGLNGVWGPSGTTLGMSLPAFGGSWSFSSSWASNVTVLGGLVTAFFATSGVSAVLFGADADQATALATVGSAVAVALAGAGAMVVLSSRGDDGAPTTFGLLTAAAVTLSAAAGQLWIGYQVGRTVDIGHADLGFLLGLIFGWLLLGIYAVRSLRHALVHGTDAPPKATITEAIGTVTLAPTRAPLL